MGGEVCLENISHFFPPPFFFLKLPGFLKEKKKSDIQITLFQ